jgi:hypothetical protein
MEKEPRISDQEQTPEQIKAFLATFTGRSVDLIIESSDGSPKPINNVIVEKVEDDKVFLTFSDKDGTVKSNSIEISMIKEVSIKGKTGITLEQRIQDCELAFEKNYKREMTPDEKEKIRKEYEDMGFNG